MRRAPRPHNLSPHEFELDLAPLLAVMVKLVPVLLISSAFIQVMMVETDLPQAVKEAIKKEEDKPTANILIKANLKDGLEVVVAKGGQQVVKVELNPDANIPYRDVVKITYEARRSRDKDVKFPVYDAKENKTVMTDYMFPDVVFSNVFDG